MCPFSSLAKMSNMRLINALDPAANFQEIERTCSLIQENTVSRIQMIRNLTVQKFIRKRKGQGRGGEKTCGSKENLMASLFFMGKN